jgi:hypothetical protein
MPVSQPALCDGVNFVGVSDGQGEARHGPRGREQAVIESPFAKSTENEVVLYTHVLVNWWFPHSSGLYKYY